MQNMLSPTTLRNRVVKNLCAQLLLQFLKSNENIQLKNITVFYVYWTVHHLDS